NVNGCVGGDEVLVVESNLMADVALNVDPNCDGGTAAASVGGGTPPYTFSWSDGTMGPLASFSAPGNYSLTVEDGSGCIVIHDFFLPNNSNINAGVEVIHVSCNGNSDGAIEIALAGGEPPYNYLWSDGFTEEDRSGLSAGVYVVTISDNSSNNCPFIQEFQILEPSALVINNVLITNTSCFDFWDGNVSLDLFGGTPGYSFEWNDGSTQAGLWNVAPGAYFVTITDNNGCTLVGGPYEVSSPAPIEVDIVVDANSCVNNGTGSIDVTVSGGTGTYAYEWVGPGNFFSTEEDLMGIIDGVYTLVVVDDNGCVDSLEITVELENPLELTITGSAQSCAIDGSATVTAMGGSGNYTYLWSNGANTSTIDNLSGGVYSVTVSDDNGCTALAETLIDSPIDLLVSSIQADCDGNNGSAAAAVLGGATDPSFVWSNGAVGPVQNDLAPGFYSVTVTDALTNCSTHENVEVQQDELCSVRISGYVYLELNGDCVEDNTTLAVANVMVQLSNGQITFTDIDGYYEFESELTDVYAVTADFSAIIFDPLCADPITVNALTLGEHYDNNNFYLEYDANLSQDLNVKVSKPNARPGFTQKVRICLMNVGAVPVTGVLTYVHPEPQLFTQAVPNETTFDESSRTVTWNFESIPPSTVWVYNAYMYTPTTVPIGTPLEYYFRADPITGDLTPFDNERYCSMVVTGSYDPNDKQVEPIGIGEEGIISKTDTLLSYHIRFQNTGTDTAFTVVIRDELDEDLEVNSVVPGPASHPYTLDILDGNILEFTFENIMLPDSNVNEPESHGFVFFDIQTQPNLEYGTSLENTAAIYFDFNEPIITNTVSNLIQMIVNTEMPEQVAIPMQLLPNPLATEGQLKFELSESSVLEIDLLDMNGRQVKSFAKGLSLPSGAHQQSIDLSGLVNGVYYLRLTSANHHSGLLKVIKIE
ncbi:MAG: T9SS type A sorting domain-containing protein, partial [Bacteroidota bacterium]